MSKKQQPLPFTRPNLVSVLPVNPLKILAKHNPAKSIEKVQTQTGKSFKEEPLEVETVDKRIEKKKNEKPLAYRTKMCPHGRDCKIKNRCNFAHTAQQLRRPFYKRTKPCLLYQRGQCSLGSACRQYHGNMQLKSFNQKDYKTTICLDFENGNCPLGNICTKAHGNQELQYYKNEATIQEKERVETQQQEKDILALRLVSFQGRRRGYKLEVLTTQQFQKSNDVRNTDEQQSIILDNLSFSLN